MPAPVNRPFAILAAWLLALSVLAVAVTREGLMAGSLDDVFVVLHEARGWAAHIGLLPDTMADEGLGRPTVEGATSPADVVVKMISMVLAPSADPLVVAGWVCLGWLAMGALVIAHGAVALGAGRLQAAAVAAGWACSLGLVEAASYRLEGALFAAVWGALLVAAARERRNTALVLSVLLCAVRPEGFVLGPAAALCAHRSSPSAIVVARCVSSAAPVLGARLIAFGSWAPQSYRAKSSDDRWLEFQDGLGYLDASLRTPAGAALLVLAAGVLWSLWVGRAAQGGPRSSDRLRCSLLSITSLAAVILVLSGGDGYAGSRLALPLAAPVWIAASVPAFSGVTVQRVCLGLALCLQIVGLQPSVGEPRREGLESLNLAWSTVNRLRAGPSGLEAFEGDQEVLRAAAEALGRETLAHRHAQRFRWFSPGLHILDLTGLTSKEVGDLPAPHRVTFGRDAIAYAIDERVGALHLDVLRARPSPLAGESPKVLADEMHALRFVGPPPLGGDVAARLAEQYVCASYLHPGAAGWFNLLVRKDLVGRFEAAGFRLRP